LPPISTSTSQAGVTRLSGEDVGDAIRSEEISGGASRVAALPAVRAALLFRQRAFRRPPGLVADGRDMGAVVFPDSMTKVFLTASVEIRAERRHKQLIEKGIAASIAALLLDLRERDERDSQRCVAPMQQSADAELLDTTNLTIATAVAQVLDWVNKVSERG
jgi:3-phosphoshikimate 1-carboxyvinyltransferase